MIEGSDAEYVDLLSLSTLHLKRLGKDRIPNKIASGALVRYKGRMLVITAGHLFKKSGHWAVELSYNEELEETALYGLGEVCLLKQGNLLSGELEDIDFAYKVLDEEIHPQHVEFDAYYRLSRSVPKRVIDSNLEDTPNLNDEYGFCGNVKPVGEGGIVAATRLPVPFLQFKENRGDILEFVLPFEIENREHLRGTSGAPILNRKGKMMSVVASGIPGTRRLFGINLKKYKMAVDIDCGFVQ